MTLHGWVIVFRWWNVQINKIIDIANHLHFYSLSITQQTLPLFFHIFVYSMFDTDIMSLMGISSCWESPTTTPTT
eukprot:gnl/Chilomastix_caulleri/7201.p1 GENE.gnl/Chilomastix_caulleri/7201~~gnl/Chilomastix_caulleri/7201.p1  ORF type:complete len:75 (+),score=7.88 gnl/Chilomastix_caulleri/7201:126-350(+)